MILCSCTMQQSYFLYETTSLWFTAGLLICKSLVICYMACPSLQAGESWRTEWLLRTCNRESVLLYWCMKFNFCSYHMAMPSELDNCSLIFQHLLGFCNTSGHEQWTQTTFLRENVLVFKTRFLFFFFFFL